MRIAKNPILPGFYPDPSICRVGDTYYMVNSTFAYFPGVPIFAGKNLAQWEQIGNVLNRPSQVPLSGCGHSEGIYAPTIRWHDGTFYMITTNVSGGGNFIVTAQNPRGSWSEPYYLGEAAKGIDPSLFFDEDGNCYYIGQRENSAGSTYFGDCEIWIQRLDLHTMQLTGEAKTVLHGFFRYAVWPEGPHLYKKDGYYYILHAESGTEFHHCIVAARSRDLWGPYEYCPSNPILTHRHLGRQYPVTCVGHGDLVEDGHGSWYMVMLASRPEDGYTLMGRETFLAKVIWEEGWPVVNPGVGRLTDTVEVPDRKETSDAAEAPDRKGIACTVEVPNRKETSDAAEARNLMKVLRAIETPDAMEQSDKAERTGAYEKYAGQAKEPEAEGETLKIGEVRKVGWYTGEAQAAWSVLVYRFKKDALPPEFLMLRNPPADLYSLKERQGFLRLFMKGDTLKDRGTPAYLALRQRHRAYEVQAAFEVKFTGVQGECAGMAIVQSNENHLRMECYQTENGLAVRLIRCGQGEDILLAENNGTAPARKSNGRLRVKITVCGLEAAFDYAVEEEEAETELTEMPETEAEADGQGLAEEIPWKLLAEHVDLRSLSTERAGGFVGCTVGMYASANGGVSAGYADFKEFAYKRM